MTFRLIVHPKMTSERVPVTYVHVSTTQRYVGVPSGNLRGAVDTRLTDLTGTLPATTTWDDYWRQYHQPTPIPWMCYIRDTDATEVPGLFVDDPHAPWQPWMDRGYVLHAWQ